MQLCFADEVKKETNPLDNLQSLFAERAEDLKKFYKENVDEEKIKEIADKWAENFKKLLTEAKTDFENINAKKE